MHRRDSFNKLIGTLNYTKSFYSHFLIEHTKGHHYNVATLEDAATSRLGESFYWYLPRCIYQGFISSWNIEKERLVRLNKDASAWTFDN